jgi:hypothetical protein
MSKANNVLKALSEVATIDMDLTYIDRLTKIQLKKVLKDRVTNDYNFKSTIKKIGADLLELANSDNLMSTVIQDKIKEIGHKLTVQMF